MKPEELKRLEDLYAFERERYAQGSRGIVGLDEVGRGSIAGPVTVGACILPEFLPIEFLNDSKKLTPRRREKVAEELRAAGVSYAIRSVSPQDIDAIGIAGALRRAMREALEALEGRFDTVLIDGNPLGVGAHEISIVKGDAKIACISAASVLAKVARDEYMSQQAELYPEYAWDSNKGYASAAHIEAIRVHGLTPLHRSTFCKNFIE